MWYTGQFHSGDRGGTSHIFYAVSEDGIHFQRKQDEPVLWPEEPWEKSSLMCPDVMWDEEEQLYKMWYSGGEKYEPNAIGYAVSKDGIHWEKRAGNPCFSGQIRRIRSLRRIRARGMERPAINPMRSMTENRWMLWYNGRKGHVEQIGVAVHEGWELGFQGD